MPSFAAVRANLLETTAVRLRFAGNPRSEGTFASLRAISANKNLTASDSGKTRHTTAKAGKLPPHCSQCQQTRHHCEQNQQTASAQRAIPANCFHTAGDFGKCTGTRTLSANQGHALGGIGQKSSFVDGDALIVKGVDILITRAMASLGLNLSHNPMCIVPVGRLGASWQPIGL